MAYGKAGDWYVNNNEGGGGETTVLFDGNVTTEAQQIGEPTGTIEGLTEITADTIKVTFNGTEYTCQKTDDGYGDHTFAEYPFFIDSWQGSVLLGTQTAGTYSLKIEEPQSGGGESDFSTAEVTVNGNGLFAAQVASLSEEGLKGRCLKTPMQNSFTVVLYQGSAIMETIAKITPPFTIPESETNIVYDEDNGWYLITGDCTITIS